MKLEKVLEGKYNLVLIFFLSLLFFIPVYGQNVANAACLDFKGLQCDDVEYEGCLDESTGLSYGICTNPVDHKICQFVLVNNGFTQNGTLFCEHEEGCETMACPPSCYPVEERDQCNCQAYWNFQGLTGTFANPESCSISIVPGTEAPTTTFTGSFPTTPGIALTTTVTVDIETTESATESTTESTTQLQTTQGVTDTSSSSEATMPPATSSVTAVITTQPPKSLSTLARNSNAEFAISRFNRDFRNRFQVCPNKQLTASGRWPCSFAGCRRQFDVRWPGWVSGIL